MAPLVVRSDSRREAECIAGGEGHDMALFWRFRLAANPLPGKPIDRLICIAATGLPKSLLWEKGEFDN